ncbi:MAG TPA: helix-turn-helix domain-containing protein [Pyrinomonadaceae bacterium]|nr:helix-turn-helix domain-containing protein [Pyrinomonadaceae bacterium]
MRRREGDGCPVAGALQLVGDKWTMLVVRDLVAGPKRTTELLAALHPISSRTLVGRLRDMERDALIERRDLGGSPPHVEYVLTERGRRLLPFLDALRRLGQSLDCNDCDDRRERLGDYCDACPRREVADEVRPPTRRRREPDDSIVLL